MGKLQVCRAPHLILCIKRKSLARSGQQDKGQAQGLGRMMVESLQEACAHKLSPLLPPCISIFRLISTKIRYGKNLEASEKFLWRWGKWNQKKFHLVNWNMVRRSKNEGGMQIRDPHLSNLAMGGKVLWQTLTQKSTGLVKLFEKII